jgi:hydrogenase maturation factor
VSVAVDAPDGHTRLEAGKLPIDLLARLLGELPAPPPELRLGPAVGEDACAIDVTNGTLVAATDPITLTTGELGRTSVIVNANDVAVTGARPRWFLSVILVPPGTGERELDDLFGALVRALESIGAHLVGGHTEITSAVTRPIVIGQMLGMVESGGTLVATGGVRPGDVVVQVGPAPVEGAAVLAREATDDLATLDSLALKAARAALELPGISVVEPALLAARLGATALHDPTEGGLAAGLHELARAFGVRIGVDRKAVLWFEPGVAVCQALGVDPWATLASGTLLAAFPTPLMADELAEVGYATAVLGRAEAGAGVYDFDGQAIPWPERDEIVGVRRLDRVRSCARAR